jgi:hypothetical protein
MLRKELANKTRTNQSTPRLKVPKIWSFAEFRCDISHAESFTVDQDTHERTSTSGSLSSDSVQQQNNRSSSSGVIILPFDFHHVSLERSRQRTFLPSDGSSVDRWERDIRRWIDVWRLSGRDWWLGLWFPLQGSRGVFVWRFIVARY